MSTLLYVFFNISVCLIHKSRSCYHAKSPMYLSSETHPVSRNRTACPGERGIALGEFIAVLKRCFQRTLPRETEAKLAKSGDGIHLKTRVKPKLLASLSRPANLVRSLGKFATFSVGSDSRRAYPGNVLFAGRKFAGHGTLSRRFSKCSVIQLSPLLNNICCQLPATVLANLSTRQTLSPDLSISRWYGTWRSFATAGCKCR